MRVRVEEDVCQGHTLCAATAPALFKLKEENGHAYVDDEVVPEGMEADAERAALGCPEGAIIIEA